MIRIFVLFERKKGARFDRHYCRTAHLAAIRAVCEPHGLVDVECLFPIAENDPYEAIIVLRYPRPDCLEAVLADPESRRLFADVARFTDILPRLSRMA
ncbi:hypothetical protein MTR62_08120 [Novosphingobium sp. 1949]|uniref:EthD domain-containing protein n=1 Tax=Novosphingobium organovorum TaxID=2930092 RepID=A0ABT0BCX9_9SPHN|nr:EthD domain-containing protein [Novosphingobium organovorum]MCJ2182656.1 hypothetical protein [Novosphingobium organovorum]